MTCPPGPATLGCHLSPNTTAWLLARPWLLSVWPASPQRSLRPLAWLDLVCPDLAFSIQSQKVCAHECEGSCWWQNILKLLVVMAANSADAKKSLNCILKRKSPSDHPSSAQNPPILPSGIWPHLLLPAMPTLSHPPCWPSLCLLSKLLCQGSEPAVPLPRMFFSQ